MTKSRKNGGFTLVELIVTIAVGSVITLAATTVLLLGLRVNNQSTETVQNQNTTRILLSALEDMASEGTIKQVVQTGRNWEIIGGEGEGERTIFSYDYSTATVYSGAIPGNSSGNTDGTPLLENVSDFFAAMGENNLLTVSVETPDGVFSSSIYCRMNVTAPKFNSTGSTENEDDATSSESLLGSDQIGSNVEGENNKDARQKFLMILAGQYLSGEGNRGIILDNGYSTGQYYSQWYSSNWSKDTPWCACFVSWALSEVEKADFIDHPAGRSKWYANVDRFAEYFTEINQWEHSADKVGDYTPVPGDLIFFDWNCDGDLQHVGVVLAVGNTDKTDSKTYVYTIEGNTGNKVAVRKYLLSDSRIAGYGVLPWKTPDSTSG